MFLYFSRATPIIVAENGEKDRKHGYDDYTHNFELYQLDVHVPGGPASRGRLAGDSSGPATRLLHSRSRRRRDGSPRRSDARVVPPVRLQAKE